MRALHQPFTVVFAVLFGILAAPMLSISLDGITGLYDRAFPVVDMRAEVVAANADEVRLRVFAVKRRPCTYVRLRALIEYADGSLGDANIRRLDRQEDGTNREVGRYVLGEWLIWPRDGAVAVRLAANHLCGERLVVSQAPSIRITAGI